MSFTQEQMTAGSDLPSYRQLHHWTSKGLLLTEDGAGSRGTGYPRTWQHGERDIARRMVRLLEAGLVLERAHDVARYGTTQPRGTGYEYEIAPGVTVLVDVDRRY